MGKQLPAKLVISQSEKGGPGKTTVCEGLVAGFRAAGLSVLVVDCDDGNSGFTRRAIEPDAIPLPWTTDASALPGWLEENIGDHDVMVIDCGSNLLASQAPVNGFLGELVFKAREENATVDALALCSTNAPGTGRLAQAMITSYGDYATICVIRNNVDGSGAFCRDLGSVGLSSAGFPHIPGGIMAARLADKRPLLTVLTDPANGFSRAMGLYAKSIASFLRETQIAGLMGVDAAAPLSKLTARAPDTYHFTIRTLSAATDAALAANEKVAELRKNLGVAARADRTDLVSIGQIALDLVDSEDRYNRLVR